MAKATINVGEWRDFKRDLDRYAKRDQQRILRNAADQVGVTFDNVVKKKLPPNVRKLKAAPHWTAKQRKWWWATMRAKADGKSNKLPGWKAKWRQIKGKKTLVISGGYKRTGTLVRTLTWDVEQSSTVTAVKYGTNVKYAKWVIDLDHQSKYHRGNWLTLQIEAQRATPLLRDVFADVVFEQTRKSLS
ncbi:MAG: hypothetical protein ACYTEQ_06580 [Planctomycetota bacterium]|jgi:hypothetical protein